MIIIAYLGIFFFSLLSTVRLQIALSLGPHIYAILILSVFTLSIWREKSLNRLKLWSFPLISGLLFIYTSIFGPYFQSFILNKQVFYVRNIQYLIPVALAYSLLCYVSLNLGLFISRYFRKSYYRLEYLKFSKYSFGRWIFYAVFVIWIFSYIYYLGGPVAILYSDTSRFANQFALDYIQVNLILISRFAGIGSGFLSIAIFYKRNNLKLPVQSKIILIISYIGNLLYFDRGKFIEIAVIIFLSFILSSNFSIRKSLKLLILPMILIFFLNINSSGRIYNKTGLLNIPSAVSYGIKNKMKNPYSLTMETGGPMPMTTQVINLKFKGVKRPISDYLYQINPIPSFLLPKTFKPNFFFENYFNTIGYSGVPVPLVPFSYDCFGSFGFFIFIFAGIFFGLIYNRIIASQKINKNLLFIVPSIIYPIAIAGFAYTMMHGEPRGAIRMMLYVSLFFWLIKFFNRKIIHKLRDNN